MAKEIFQKHFAVIDLETLGIGSDAVILSLGLTLSRYDDNKTFDELINEGLYLKFDIKEQLTKGRKMSARVVKWWYEQSFTAKEILLPSRTLDVSLYSLVDLLPEFFTKRGIDIMKVDMYDRKSFDLSKLQYMYEEELGLDIPWNYHQDFELSTAFRFLGLDRYGGIQVKDIPGAVYHNAIHDAAVDHLRMFKALNSIQGE